MVDVEVVVIVVVDEGVSIGATAVDMAMIGVGVVGVGATIGGMMTDGNLGVTEAVCGSKCIEIRASRCIEVSQRVRVIGKQSQLAHGSYNSGTRSRGWSEQGDGVSKSRLRLHEW